MKELNVSQMEELNGGGCGWALFGMGVSILGAGLSFATLNPVGTAVGIAAIYASGPAVALNC